MSRLHVFKHSFPSVEGCTKKDRAFCELPHFLAGFQHSVNLNVKEDVKKGKNKSKSATELLTAKCAENYPLTKIREAGLHRSWPAVKRKVGVTQESRSTSQGEGGRHLEEQRLHTDTDGEVAEVHTVCWTWPETGRRAVQLQPRLHVTIRNTVRS